jgi:hypothetical protein
MNTHRVPRVRRTALATAVATLALWGSFGASVHADEEPVAGPPAETGESNGAVVAVGPPPVPPSTVVVAVGAPPVPPAPVVVAVGAPPVPPARAMAPPSSVPARPEHAKVSDSPRATPQSVAAVRRPIAVMERLTAMFTDVIARIEAILALLDTGF